jgi:hypothetical protein
MFLNIREIVGTETRQYIEDLQKATRQSLDAYEEHRHYFDPFFKSKESLL